MIELKDKCRGRGFHPGTYDEALEICNNVCKRCPERFRDPIKEKPVNGTFGIGGFGLTNNFKPEKYNVVVFSTIPEYTKDGEPWHTYWVSTSLDRKFVKSFKDGKLKTTNNENEAYKFRDDDECTACMEFIIKNEHPWTIALWDDVGQMVAYPNEHWWKNNNLMPSLMHRTVTEFNERFEEKAPESEES